MRKIQITIDKEEFKRKLNLGDNPKCADESSIVKRLMSYIPSPDDISKKIRDWLNAIFIRDALETLTEDERLDSKSVKGIDKLEEEIAWLKEEIKKERGRKTVVFGGGVGGGRIVKSHDLSDSLNGVTKVFSLPAFWRVLLVQSSSFPNAFRPNVDYTIDASTSKITFTSEIEASTTLASGQTIIVLYSE